MGISRGAITGLEAPFTVSRRDLPFVPDNLITSETSEYHTRPSKAPTLLSTLGAGWGVLRTSRTIQAGNQLSQIEADPRFEATVGGFEERSIGPGGRGLRGFCPTAGPRSVERPASGYGRVDSPLESIDQAGRGRHLPRCQEYTDEVAPPADASVGQQRREGKARSNLPGSTVPCLVEAHAVGVRNRSGAPNEA